MVALVIAKPLSAATIEELHTKIAAEKGWRPQGQPYQLLFDGKPRADRPKLAVRMVREVKP